MPGGHGRGASGAFPRGCHALDQIAPLLVPWVALEGWVVMHNLSLVCGERDKTVEGLKHLSCKEPCDRQTFPGLPCSERPQNEHPQGTEARGEGQGQGAGAGCRLGSHTEPKITPASLCNATWKKPSLSEMVPFPKTGSIFTNAVTSVSCRFTGEPGRAGPAAPARPVSASGGLSWAVQGRGLLAKGSSHGA